MLVAELRYDIAFTKLQHSIGKMYSSAGINVTEENVKKMGVKKYAEIIENNFKTKGKKYFAKVKKPIQKQNPVAKNKGDGFNEFKFDDNIISILKLNLEHSKLNISKLIFLFLFKVELSFLRNSLIFTDNVSLYSSYQSIKSLKYFSRASLSL